MRGGLSSAVRVNFLVRSTDAEVWLDALRLLVAAPLLEMVAGLDVIRVVTWM